jgi:CelD/BcsL family acetyltransferase involved in cellulose biosynthesis
MPLRCPTRLDGLGGPHSAGEASEPSLFETASRALIAQLRFRLWSIRIDNQMISSTVFLSAGGETPAWLCGFDEEWNHLQSSILTIQEAIKHGFEVGDCQLDLGAGAQPYEYRF